VDVRRLITIPISHYCEKARWALDYARLDYTEERHVQLVHIVALRLAGGNRTSPALICDEGVVRESGAIVGYAAQRAPADRALEPEDPVERAEAMRVERWLDVELGPHGRRWTYFRMKGQTDLVRKYNLTGVPAWERAAFPVANRVVLRGVERVLRITPETAGESKQKTLAVFDTVAERLADGRRYLVGDRFSRADLAFAALAGAVILPELYGVPLPRIDELDEVTARESGEFRDHPAGRFALRIYDEHRR
jgi:glutathione S-transferase